MSGVVVHPPFCASHPDIAVQPSDVATIANTPKPDAAPYPRPKLVALARDAHGHYRYSMLHNPANDTPPKEAA